MAPPPCHLKCHHEEVTPARQQLVDICGACRSLVDGLTVPATPQPRPDNAETTVVSMANCFTPERKTIRVVSAGRPVSKRIWVAKHIQPCSTFAERVIHVEGQMQSDEEAGEMSGSAWMPVKLGGTLPPLDQRAAGCRSGGPRIWTTLVPACKEYISNCRKSQ